MTITSVTAYPATEGTLLSPSVSGTFTDTNSVSATLLTANIDYGDGTVHSSANIVKVGLTTYTFTDAHTPPEEGSFVVTVHVFEIANAANTDSATTPTAVADAPLTAVTAAPTSFSGTGSSATNTALNNFAAAIGGPNNGATPTEQSVGFRRVNWDGVKVDGTDAVAGPNSTTPIPAGSVHTVAIPVNRMQASGLELATPYAVSNDGFIDVNPTTSGLFAPFSPANVLAPFNTNQVELDFVAPSSPTTTPVGQGTRGFGIVFLNVQQPGTSVQFFDGNDLLATAPAPVSASPGQPSFVGELFNAPLVTRVVITLGAAQIFNFDGTTVTSGGANTASNNLVAADDVAFAEPAPFTPAFNATAGVPFSATVASFNDTDPNGNAKDFTALTRWGDANHSVDAVSAGGSGEFDIAGTHTFAQAGSFTIATTVDDFGGATDVIKATVRVAARPTATTVACAPSATVLPATSACTATVADTGPPSATAPTGGVSFSSDIAGSSLVPAASCTLAPTGTPGQSSCQLTYAPTVVGSGTHHVTAAYGGDGAHSGSAGVGPLTVSLSARIPPPIITPHCGVTVRSARISAHATPRAASVKRSLRVSVLCNANTSVLLSGMATVKHHKQKRTLSLGSARATVLANQAATLSLTPSSSVLNKLRSAAKRHDQISAKLTLAATLTAGRSTATATIAKLTV